MIETHSVPMFRAPHKGARYRRTLSAALRDRARHLLRQRHPCECEGPDHGEGYPGWECGAHGEWVDALVARYVRIGLLTLRAARAKGAAK